MSDLTTDKIIETLNTEFGLIREEAWFTSLRKTALSKNITIADWNSLLWQVAETVSGADAVKKALTEAVEVYDTHLSDVDDALGKHKDDIAGNAYAIDVIEDSLSNAQTEGTVAHTLAGIQTRLNAMSSNISTNAGNVTQHIKDVNDELKKQNARFDGTVAYSKIVFDNTNLTLHVELYDYNNNRIDKSDIVHLPKQSALADFYIEGGELVLKTTDGTSVGIPLKDLLPTLTTSLDSDDNAVAMSAATGALIKKAISDAVADKATTTALNDAVSRLNTTLEDVSNNIKGAPGDSAYDIAVKDGFDGDVDQWLESLKGADGADGVGIEGPIGPRGVSVSGIAYVSSSTVDGATVDEYAVNFDDPTIPPATFYVTNGKNGADGTSLTHSWVGDQLEITSKSGTTLSKSLKGVGIKSLIPGDVIGRKRNYSLKLTDDSLLSFYVYDGTQGTGISKIELLEDTVGTDGRTVHTYRCVLGDDSVAGTFKVYDGAVGPAGPAFSVAKVYSTVNEMRDDYANEDVPINAFVVVSEYEFDDGVGGALFIKGPYEFNYVLRFTGIQGPPGTNGKDGTNGTNGTNGKDGVSITDAIIDGNGVLHLKLSNGDILACGKVVGDDGATPSISTDGYWIVGGAKTEVKAKGENGTDGHTPIVKIAADGEWLIDGVRQGVNAIGVDGNDGVTPYIDSNGYWVVNNTTTPYKAIGVDGKPGTRGTDGVSVTHSWNGTSLVVTSASGTSTKDLKGASAYELAQKNGYKGTEAEWVDSLNKDTKNILTTDGDLLQVFVGTAEEYAALPNHDNLFAIITDDDSLPVLDAAEKAFMPTKGLLFEKHTEGLREVYDCVGIGTATDVDITIPSTYEGLPVRGIGAKAFYDTSIRSVRILSGVWNIGEKAFDSCGDLKHVDLGTVSSIGDYAFRNCDIQDSLEVPAIISNIGKYAFAGNDALKNVTFVEGRSGSYIQEIKEFTFDGCTLLKSINIPEGVTTIGEFAFRGAPIEYLILPKTLKTIGRYAFANNDALRVAYIPFGMLGSVGSSAFYGNGNTRIFCNGESRPNSWASDWVRDITPVIWGCTNPPNTYKAALAHSADEATRAVTAESLAIKYAYSKSNVSSYEFDVTLTVGKIYVITVGDTYGTHTMLLLNTGGANSTSVYSTVSGFHNRYCKYDYSQSKLRVYDGTGNAHTVTSIQIREI